jgi:hypothetical protein
VIRTALVVTPDQVELDRWAKWLEAEGFLTVACAGPRLRPSCPRLNGERCLLRDAVDVAVVAMPVASGPVAPGERAEASCTTSPDNGTTLFVDESGIVGTVTGAPERVPLTAKSLIEAVTDLLSLVPAEGRLWAAP